MKAYIYKLKQENLIEISKDLKNFPQTEESDFSPEDNFELLFTPDIDNFEKVLLDLREFKCLDTKENLYKNKDEVFDYFSNELYKEESEPLKVITERESTNILERYKNIFNLLNKKKFILSVPKKLSEPKFIYTVDVYNYMSDVYGDKALELMIQYDNLSKDAKEIIAFIDEIPTRERKENYLNEKINSLGDEIYNTLRFLPDWYRLKYKISGQSSELDTRDSPCLAEISDSTTLGKDVTLIQKELFISLKTRIFKDFEIGKTYSGAFIISKLRDIYKELGIKKTAKICDLYEFFEYKKVNLRYHISEYKLVTRKIV